MGGEKLTEYERQRIDNIKRNEEMLAALKIHSQLSQLSALTKRPRAKSKSYQASPEKKHKSKSPTVLRRSLRTQGIPPDSSTASGLKDDFDDRIASPNKNLQPIAKKSPREPIPISMRDAYSGDFDISNQKLIETIKGFSHKINDESMDKNSVLGDWIEKRKASGAVNLESLRLEPDNIARVVPGRILNVRFFPTNNVRMVAVGNKFGNISFWNVDASQEDGDGIYLYHPHSGPVSGILMDPFSVSKMFTSCYDGFIRVMDIEKEMFDLAYLSEHSIFSISQRPHDMKSIYYGEGSGELGIWDLRAGKSSALWKLHQERINTIDFTYENCNIMATSSTDGSACIWDLRKVSAHKPKSLQTAFHKRAVHSAYFSPSGRFLATTSVDNNVGLLSGANYEETSMISHYNHTNRWISSFRGIWGWDDSYIYIGNMQRGVDVISVADKKLDFTLRSEHMTAIPCRFDAHHEVVGMLAGATSGGQVYIWTAS
ncbi:WD repeat-containing protein 76 [Capsicum galapagoense]